MNKFQRAIDRVWFNWYWGKKGWQLIRKGRMLMKQEDELSAQDVATGEDWTVIAEIQPQAGKYVMGDEMKNTGTFEYWKAAINKQWYFRLRAANGKIICQSEGYKRKAGCLNGIAAIRSAVVRPEIIEKK